MCREHEQHSAKCQQALELTLELCCQQETSCTACILTLSGASKLISSTIRSRTVCSLLAPMLSTDVLTCKCQQATVAFWPSSPVSSILWRHITGRANQLAPSDMSVPPHLPEGCAAGWSLQQNNKDMAQYGNSEKVLNKQATCMQKIACDGATRTSFATLQMEWCR